jgi:CheY-like chemotaxis protein
MLHILLADDDPDDCALFEDALAELYPSTPVSLTIVHNGEHFIQYLEAEASTLPHAVFLDMNMPRMNGYECLTTIKNHIRFKEVPVIILSTSYDISKGRELQDTGASFFICKPADFNELKSIIHTVLAFIQQVNPIPTDKEHFLINVYLKTGELLHSPKGNNLPGESC